MTTRKTTRWMGGTLALLALSVLTGCGGGDKTGTGIAIPVNLTPSSVTVARGASQQFAATFFSGSQIVWQVYNSPGAGTITDTGLYTAPSTPGTYTVHVYDANGTGQFGNAAVTVP